MTIIRNPSALRHIYVLSLSSLQSALSTKSEESLKLQRVPVPDYRVERGEMVLSDGRVVCQELYEGWSQVEESGPVDLESRQEGGRLEPGQRHQLAAPEQDVGHGQVHGEDVEERQHTDGCLLRAHELHGGVVQLGHVRHQVPGPRKALREEYGQ